MVKYIKRTTDKKIINGIFERFFSFRTKERYLAKKSNDSTEKIKNNELAKEERLIISDNK